MQSTARHWAQPTFRKHRASAFKVVGTCLVGLVALSCKSSLETEVRSSAPASAPSPEPTVGPTTDPVAQVEIPRETAAIEGAFGETRLFYQSRSVITLKISQDVAAAGAVFSLFNDTTAKTLFDRETIALSLTGAETAFRFLSLSQDQAFILRLYPLDESLVGKWSYGENKLRILVDDGGVLRSSAATIDITDFDVQGSSVVAAEGDGSENSDFWMNSSSTPTVSAGITLTTGTGNIIND